MTKQITKTKTQDMVLEEKNKISDVSKLSILPFTQNKNFGILGKCAFTSNFDSCCNSRFRNDKNYLRQNLKGQDTLLEEKMKIPEVLKFSILTCIQKQKLINLGISYLI